MASYQWNPREDSHYISETWALHSPRDKVPGGPCIINNPFSTVITHMALGNQTLARKITMSISIVSSLKKKKEEEEGGGGGGGGESKEEVERKSCGGRDQGGEEKGEKEGEGNKDVGCREEKGGREGGVRGRKQGNWTSE